jgi:predicted Zn finger-like uncharacterized protein
MRVVCENCGASYTVPDSKLTKAMNQATCKACAHEMMIPRPGTPETDDAGENAANEEWEDEEQTRITESPLIQTPTQKPVNTPPQKPKTANLYDPSGDLAWAALGSFLSLLGAIFLGLLSLPLGDLAYVVLWTGMAFAFGGSVLTLSILSTGQRGRREANTLLSVVAAFCIGIFMSSTLTTAKWGGFYFVEKYDISFDPSAVVSSSAQVEQEALADEAPQALDLLEEETQEELADEDEEGIREEGTDPEEEEEVKSPPPLSKKVAPRAAPLAAPAAPISSPPPTLPVIEDIDDIEIPARPQPAPRARKQTRTRPAPAPAPAPVSNATVPLQTIQTIMHNTNSIKACFVPMYNTGTVPPRIDVRFTLGGNGVASNVSVIQSEYSGSPFEQCMRAAIGGIGFPASDGAGQNINFPFVLQ